jgi:hypothetical protein
MLRPVSAKHWQLVVCGFSIIGIVLSVSCSNLIASLTDFYSKT